MIWRGPRSLRWRLGLGLAAGLVIVWLSAILVAALVMRHEIEEVFDSALSEMAQRVLTLAATEELNDAVAGNPQRVALLHEHEEYLTYVVRDAQGALLLQSHDADPAAFPAYAGRGFADTATHRIYFDEALRGAVTIAAAEPLAHRRQAVREAALALAAPGLALVPLGLLGALLMTRAALTPLRRLRAAIARRDAGDLSPVTALDLPDELAPIAGALDGLLARLGRAIEAERRFAALAAHELRTPVAAARAQAQRLAAETADPAARARAAEIAAALARLTRLAARLSEMARAEGAGVLGAQPADMRRALALVLEDLARAHPDAPLPVVSAPDGPALSPLDPDAFAILARNLIENALLHGPEDEAPRVALGAAGGLSVANGGPTVAPEALAGLTAPFARGATRSAGSGLGLAIAAAIARGAGGQLDLASPAPGRPDGFEARFTPPPR